MQPFLSILIPTRNRAEYLKYAVQSALNIEDDEIEIIVSENHSSDNSAELLRKYTDPRLKIVSPVRPLPMHENWELLLSLATGEWITFIGDDDAVMPHCVEHLRSVQNRHPWAEAIVSPRAYYGWEGHGIKGIGEGVSFNMSIEETVKDSKVELDRCLNGDMVYLNLPQIYSGGYQRSSLVKRVIRSQGGRYFQSVTPDAYSAVVGCLHTYRHLEIGVPLSWVGTSSHNIVPNRTKDRDKDFYGMHTQEMCINPCFGDLRKYNFEFVFLEAFCSAFPLADYRYLSMSHIKRLFEKSAPKLLLNGQEDIALDLSQKLGFALPTGGGGYHKLWSSMWRKFKRAALKLKRIISQNWPNNGIIPTSKIAYEASVGECPTILSFDDKLREEYPKWRASYSDIQRDSLGIHQYHIDNKR